MSFNLRHLLAFVALLSIMQRVLSANCTSTINDYITYLRTSDPGYSRYVTFQMGSLKESARYLGFSSGTFSIAFNRNLAYLDAKNSQTVFSDRTWCPQLPPGEIFCTGYQKFDYRKADTFELALFTNSTAKVVLNTWGNATYRFPLQCKDGFLYGTMRQSNGKSFISISMSKQRYVIPK